MASTTDRCCISSVAPHRRCSCEKPAFDCKSECYKDSKCKGYSERLDGKWCQFATTSECPDDCWTYGSGDGNLNPDVVCGEQGTWKGCNIKHRKS